MLMGMEVGERHASQWGDPATVHCGGRWLAWWMSVVRFPRFRFPRRRVRLGFVPLRPDASPPPREALLVREGGCNPSGMEDIDTLRSFS